MKKIYFSLACMLLASVYSCNMGTSSSGSASSGNSQLDSMKSMNEQVYKGFSSGDFSAFEKMVASDAVDHGMGEKDVVGKDSIEKDLKEMNSQFKDLKFEILSESADSNYTMTMVRMTGTSNDAKTGFPAGSAVDNTSVDVLKWTDGKVTEHWVYMDSRDVMKMMASMPAPPKADSTMKK